jgi:hypothetical protein
MWKRKITEVRWDGNDGSGIGDITPLENIWEMCFIIDMGYDWTRIRQRFKSRFRTGASS